MTRLGPGPCGTQCFGLADHTCGPSVTEVCWNEYHTSESGENQNKDCSNKCHTAVFGNTAKQGLFK